MERLFEIQRIVIEQFEERPFYPRSQFDSLTRTRPITGTLLIQAQKKRKASCLFSS